MDDRRVVVLPTAHDGGLKGDIQITEPHTSGTSSQLHMRSPPTSSAPQACCRTARNYHPSRFGAPTTTAHQSGSPFPAHCAAFRPRRRNGSLVELITRGCHTTFAAH